MKYFSIISLGCPKNLVDSERFLSIFKNAGLEYTKQVEKAEVILINTCGFINEAKEEAIETILETAELKQKRLKKLIVTGCLVKRYKESLEKEIPEVDLWVDLKDFERMRSSEFGIRNSELRTPNSELRTLLTPPHHAYLRISDGCNNRCSYCSIPSIRGVQVSEKIEDLLDEARYLASLGVKELIINAQDTTRYGYDLYGKSMLVELLKRIEDLPPPSPPTPQASWGGLNEGHLFPWIRLLYLHPAHLTEDMILELAKLKTLLPYFDIPLQHISNGILTSMNRKIDKETTIKRLEFLRKVFPEAAIRTTFITGFPGETRKHFEELEAFVKSFRFTRLGVFTYSEEEGTPAFALKPKVLPKTAQNRKEKLMAIQNAISREIMQSYIGKTLDVILEFGIRSSEFGIDAGKMPAFPVFGRSYLDAPEIDGVVYITGKERLPLPALRPGTIVKVKITDALDYDLIGEIE